MDNSMTSPLQLKFYVSGYASMPPTPMSMQFQQQQRRDDQRSIASGSSGGPVKRFEVFIELNYFVDPFFVTASMWAWIKADQVGR
uniref:Uncharacterized protein n=2 Tax=Caenorhabditis japonica TaxID=281687 RepID=A0A8R1EBJ5_CAEJA